MSDCSGQGDCIAGDSNSKNERNASAVRGQCSILDDMMALVVVDRAIVYQVIDFDNDLRFEIL